MKNTLFAIVPSILIALTFACNSKAGRQMPTDSAASTASAKNVEADAADDLFINDVVLSAAETDVDNMAMPADEEKTTGDDMKQERLAKMTADLLEELDIDDNKSLTETEYLSVITKKENELSEAQKTEVTNKLKAEFKAHAGTDNVLSADELQALLKSQAVRVDKFRCKKHKGKHQERVQSNFEVLLKKYDKDADGKLNKEEFEGMRGDKKQCHRKKNGRGNGKGEKGTGNGDGRGNGGNGMDPDGVIKIPPINTAPDTMPPAGNTEPEPTTTN